jgi:hypothetical protein
VVWARISEYSGSRLEQLLVRAARHDATLVEHEHPTRQRDGGDAVRDDDGGALASSSPRRAS